jgi:alpha-glucosidase (family GH31 glycosyl hydrolase)
MNFTKKTLKAIALSAVMIAAGIMPANAVAANDSNAVTVEKLVQINPTTVELRLNDNKKVTLDFYGENIFRMFQDNSGGPLRNPVASPEAEILVKSPRKDVKISVEECDKGYLIKTSKIAVSICKKSGLMKVEDLTTGKTAFEEVAPVLFKNNKTTITLKATEGEFFYGGGVQNGRFSHAGKIIDIENQNSWTDGGVASPAPFVWSTNGYGFMWQTFRKGKYDFAATEADKVTLMHEIDYLDVFFMVSEDGIALLNDFYQLTGNPVLMPKFGFYMGHLNAYNRDYWVESKAGNGMLYEDSK